MEGTLPVEEWGGGGEGVESLKKGKNGSNVRKRTIKQKRRKVPLCSLFVNLVLETWKIPDKPHIFTESFPFFANPPTSFWRTHPSLNKSGGSFLPFIDGTFFIWVHEEEI